MNKSTNDQTNFTPKEEDVSTYRYFPDTPTDDQTQLLFHSIKEPSQFIDPCEKSAQMSRRCLEDNWENPDKKTVCKEFFETYKDCKAMWMAQKRQEARGNNHT